MSKTYVVGDIHGACKALSQCLKRSSFDYQYDYLIVLGDVCDGYPETKQSIDELLKIKHCQLLKGNHDYWALAWGLHNGKSEREWLTQGGDRTIESYAGGPMPEAHLDFLKNGRLWIERDNQLFVHGGINPDLPISKQEAQTFVWDRELFRNALKMQAQGRQRQFGLYTDIFIGHTPTVAYQSLLPIHACNVWALDTGAGWSGKLTIMDVVTKQYWQSDVTPDLYPGIVGRRLGA
jgi:serine/threonine protein phosphatase 1